ncbi:DUF935 domain-containing protein [Chitinibacter sp. S2-10]|uniref:DUF935 domain-containing protein n=1 Tax=Chitinibacter sp. S2-10 TaxID=3373597 RepID=UPI0039775729
MPKILDRYGNPFEQSTLREPQSSRLGNLPREFAQHPSRGLTPQRLARILEQAEQGDLSAQADLFCDIEEKDAHVFAEMSKRKRALLTLDWRVDPPRNATTAEKKQAEMVNEWLQDIADFEDVLLDCLDGVGHGFAALEIEWQRLGNVWLPATLEHRPQRWFKTLPHDGNALRLRDNSTEGAELLPFGWIVHKHKAKSGYLTRAGLHRVLAWPYLFKNYSVRDLAEFLEIYGLPLRLGKYPSGSTDAEKSTLLQAVASIGHNAAGIIPEGMLIEFQEAAKGSSEPFLAMIDWCEKSESKAILGGTLTSQADGKTSTNALGNVHNEVRHDLMVSDARQLASTMTRDLIYPLLAINAGSADPRRSPQFVFDAREAGDLKLYAESLPKLVDMGLRVRNDWLHDKLAIPHAQDGDEVLKPAASQTTPAKPSLPVADAKYRAVLSNAQGEVIYPDQHTLDTAGLPALDEAMQVLLAPLMQQILAGDSPDAVKAALSSAWPELDDGELQAMLTKALFVADVWGRINAAS